jgi:hypothetical protein
MWDFPRGPLIVAAPEHAARIRSEPLNYTSTTLGSPLLFSSHPSEPPPTDELCESTQKIL